MSIARNGAGAIAGLEGNGHIEFVAPSDGSPIDLVHLARQTLGDRTLEREVLMLFRQQAAAARDAVVVAQGEERRHLAHGLRGSAGIIGAYAIAACAAEIEHAPSAVGDKILHLQGLIDEALAFISDLSR